MKKGNTKSKSKAKAQKKSGFGFMKILELVVIVGTVAGVLIKMFSGSKSKKK